MPDGLRETVRALNEMQQRSLPVALCHLRRCHRLMCLQQQQQEEVLGTAADSRAHAAAAEYETSYQYALLWGCVLLLLRHPASHAQMLLQQLQEQRSADSNSGDGSEMQIETSAAESQRASENASGEDELSFAVALYRLAAAVSTDEAEKQSAEASNRLKALQQKQQVLRRLLNEFVALCLNGGAFRARKET
ncbi:hypothetical protein cyc_04593 [Cyclospora cayetanensis]|uniref:Uncharacterized protein n=1 Tax=Cyclospora cayetanensis TaxID=88456 RepID=A0A1D3D4A3_9EIME|nr:hypothetical protein cyc_04593 [Cyclospora cayetanensis]